MVIRCSGGNPHDSACRAGRIALRRQQGSAIQPRHHPPMPIDLDELRRYAVARTLFTPTTLPRAIERLGFVQADPIRAPARAQDLTLRHRVRDYRAGDLERRYPRLAIEEDFFVNYGFLPRAMHALMHPRTPRSAWPKARRAQAAGGARLRARARRGAPARGRRALRARHASRNWFGGSSQRQHAAARRHALPRPAARRAARRRHALLCGARRARRRRDDPAARALRRAGRRASSRKYAPLPAPSLELAGQPARATRAPQWRRRCAARAGARAARACRTRGSTASTGTGRPARTRPRGAMRRTTRCACSRPSTRWSGTAAASSCSGAGPTASRPTRRRRKRAARLLRAAAAVARPRDRLGQPGAARRQAAGGARLRRRPRAARRRLPPGAGRRTGPDRAAFLAAALVSASAQRPLPPGQQRAQRQRTGRAGQPGARPPGPSATQPTSVGPTIWPAAKTMVNAAMPAGQAAGGRLCRTSAVVEATTDRNTLPNSAPDANTAPACVAQHRQQRGQRQQRVQQRQRHAAAVALQQPGPQPRRGHHAGAEQQVEKRDAIARHALLAQQRDDEGHVADVAQAEHQVGRPARRRRVAAQSARSARRGPAAAPAACVCRRAISRRRQQRHRGQRATRPAATHADGQVGQRRHHGGRDDDAQPGAAVVQAQHQRCTRPRPGRRTGRCRTQAGGEQPAADEADGAGHAGQQAQQQQAASPSTSAVRRPAAAAVAAPPASSRPRVETRRSRRGTSSAPTR